MAIKIGLYSVSYLGCWYKDRPLKWDEVLYKAKELGFNGVEFDAKRPHANPMDWDCDTRKKVVELAAKLNIELPILASNNNFGSPVPEQREAELLMVREQIKLARDIGCKYLRVFGAWSGITFRDGWAYYDEAMRQAEASWPGVPRAVREKYIKDCLTEAVKIAEDEGVILVLQNHPPVLRNWRDVYDIVTAINSPNLKLCFDIPHNEDNMDNIRRAFDTFGSLDVHFHFNGEFERDKNGKTVGKPTMFGEPIQNYPFLVSELKRIGFDGYICWEYCHNVLDKNGNPGTLADVDEQTKLALEYMKDLVENS